MNPLDDSTPRQRVDGGLRRKHLSFLGFRPFLVIVEMRELLLPLFQNGHRVGTHLPAYSTETVFAGPRRGKTGWMTAAYDETTYVVAVPMVLDCLKSLLVSF